MDRKMIVGKPNLHFTIGIARISVTVTALEAHRVSDGGLGTVMVTVLVAHRITVVTAKVMVIGDGTWIAQRIERVDSGDIGRCTSAPGSYKLDVQCPA